MQTFRSVVITSSQRLKRTTKSMTTPLPPTITKPSFTTSKYNNTSTQRHSNIILSQHRQCNTKAILSQHNTAKMLKKPFKSSQMTSTTHNPLNTIISRHQHTATTQSFMNKHAPKTTSLTTPSTFSSFSSQLTKFSSFSSQLRKFSSFSSLSALKKSPLPTPLTTPKRHLFGFGTPDRITIPGAKIPVSPARRLRKIIFRLALLGLLGVGLATVFLLHLTDHLDKVMRFNIRFRGQSDIHYYATASRVNHKYNPQFTGDKVSDIKLLQAKIVRDVYKIYLATDPMERNQDLINRYLGDKKVIALREMASQDPELASEITKEVFLEAQYGLTVTGDVINAILQNIFSIYVNATLTNPSHRHSVEHLHRQFESLRVLEQDLDPMVEFVTACLDALVEGSVATPYQDAKKIQVYDPNLTDQYRVGRPL